MLRDPVQPETIRQTKIAQLISRDRLIALPKAKLRQLSKLNWREVQRKTGATEEKSFSAPIRCRRTRTPPPQKKKKPSTTYNNWKRPKIENNR